MLQFILWVYPWVWCVFKNLWPFGFIVLSYLCSRDNHGRRSQSNFHFLCILGTSWTEATNFTCLQKIYVPCHSSSVLTSGNHGSQFLYRLQSNINLKMEKVPPYSYNDDCLTNQFCFWLFKRLKKASRCMTLSSTSSSPITLETMTSSAMRSQREHRSFSEDWKVIKIQRELDDEWCLFFDLYHRP